MSKPLKAGKWVYFRRAAQGLFLFLFLYSLLPLPLPGSFLIGRLFFGVNPFLSLTASLGGRVFLSILISSSLLLLISLFAGRCFCGWICPLGTAIDLAGILRKKIVRQGREIKSVKLRGLKYLFLAAFLIIAGFGLQTAWIMDPIAIAGRFVSLNLMPAFYGGERLFTGAGWIFVPFALVILLVSLSRRFWCRHLCPLGGLLALAGRFSILERRVDRSSCPSSCRFCSKVCRTGAIKEDVSYTKQECILCMDCIYLCPGSSTRFTLKKENRKKKKEEDPSRRNFLILAGLSVSAVAAGWKKKVAGSEKKKKSPIRPPGALEEELFFSLCIRCGNCMGSCPTNTLQPDILSGGIETLWTPRVVPEIGECSYDCNRCGQVCPTGAIPSLPMDAKKKTRMGTASIDTGKCIPWRERGRCLRCRSSCPVPGNAVGITRKEGKRYDLPVILPDLCIGCGMCQNVCPVRPERAVKVDPATAVRGRL